MDCQSCGEEHEEKKACEMCGAPGTQCKNDKCVCDACAMKMEGGEGGAMPAEAPAEEASEE